MENGPNNGRVGIIGGMPRIPVVGQSATIHEIRPFIVASCPCKKTEKPIVIDQFGHIVTCEGCGDEYFIKKWSIESDGESGRIDVSLGRRAVTAKPGASTT